MKVHYPSFTTVFPLFIRHLIALCCGILAFQAFGGQPRVMINFPFRDETEAASADVLAKLQELGAPAMRQMAFHDVFWWQVQPAAAPPNYVKADAAINNSQGVMAFPTLYSMMDPDHEADVGLRVPWRTDSTYGGWSYARDAADSATYVTDVINRYKTRVKFWEVANEMNSATSPPKGMEVENFAAFLNYNHAWIKAADSSASVVMPGLLGTYGFPFSNSIAWLDGLLTAGGGTGFDVANYHDYNSWWTLPTHYDMVRTKLDSFGLHSVPIWVTETGVASEHSGPGSVTPSYASPEGQAADVWRRFALLYGKGAQLVAWHALLSLSDTDATGWNKFGLFEASGNKKKSWHSMRLLISRLEGFRRATLMSTGVSTDSNTVGGEGSWVVRFDCRDGVQRYVMWGKSPPPVLGTSSPPPTYTLGGLTPGTQFTVTQVVPVEITPMPVFSVTLATATAASYTFALTEEPILVEPAPPLGLVLDTATGLMSWPEPIVGTALLETSLTMAPGSWTGVPPAHLELTIQHGYCTASYVGPPALRRFFRLRWSPP